MGKKVTEEIENKIECNNITGFNLGFNKGYTLALERLLSDISYSLPCANESPIEFAFKDEIINLIQDKLNRFNGK